jgi:hypothetical protein
MEASEKLKKLYEEMHELTLPECGKCRRPYSCCSKEYCHLVKEYALEAFGVELESTGNEKLPFMGEKGCVVPPYLRPLCTLHTCSICSLGTSKNLEWDAKYFELREQIDSEETILYNASEQ